MRPVAVGLPPGRRDGWRGDFLSWLTRHARWDASAGWDSAGIPVGVGFAGLVDG
jgi:hypothetical protein